jgi:hypothetical protein
MSDASKCIAEDSKSHPVASLYFIILLLELATAEQGLFLPV